MTHPDDRNRDDLAELLPDLLSWQLTADGWQRVDAALTVVAGGLAAGDQTVVASAVATLELLGPRRANRLGRTPDRQREPAASQIRERINDIIHRLGPRVEGERRDADRAG